MTTPRQLRQLWQLGWQLPAELRRPVRAEEAATHLRRQLAEREQTFLTAARRLIYEHPASPYGRLLRWAGCEWADLHRGVTADGLEPMLARLRDAGAYLTFAEFKRQTPICRNGLTFEPAEADFDNPLLSGGGIEGSTSGSRSAAMRVMYNWAFIADETAHELILYTHHGVLDAPLALWYPAPPGVAGVHNLMMNLKLGRAPARWFSQTDSVGPDVPRWHHWAMRGIRLGGRLAGLKVPRPELADLSAADRVLDWMGETMQRHRSCVLRTFASSAVRLAERARLRSIDLTGATIFTGGEPLTDARRQFIEATGAQAFPRYVATESGLIGAACRQRKATDDMHVYSDRIALITGADGLLVSTLSPATGKVLLNTELGDTGELSTRRCDCELGRLGFDRHVMRVRSQHCLTVEGMTVSTADVDAIIGEVIAQAGGHPASYQLRQMHDGHGLNRLVVAISPDVGRLDEARCLAAIHDGMRRRGGAVALAADVWRQAGTFQIVREHPTLSPGAKLSSGARTS